MFQRFSQLIYKLRWSFLTIILSWAASMGIVAITFPHLLTKLSINFANASCHDYGVPYHNVFTLISHFYHGGIQLWNRYDMLSDSFNHASWGIYTLSNILTSTLYIIAAPFMQSESVGFHTIYAWGYFGFNALIRTIGGYLLLRKFTPNKWIIAICLVILNTIFSSQMNLGLLTNNLYSYAPLLTYFILRFFDHFKLLDFFCIIGVLALCFSNSPLFALGYFYEGVHYLLFLCVVFYIFRRWKKWSHDWKTLSQSWREPYALPFILGITLLSVLIAIPTLVLCIQAKKDFFIEGSGLSGTHGRFNNMFSPFQYFKNPIGYAEHRTIFSGLLDPWANNWWVSWMFLGFTPLFLAVSGYILHRDWRKHLFMGTSLLIILANSQRIFLSLGGIPHTINALTNPLKFLLRSHHMTLLNMPYYLIPLVACGLAAYWDLMRGKSENIHASRLKWIPFLLLTLIAAAAYYLPDHARKYVIFSSLGTLFLLSLILIAKQKSLHPIAQAACLAGLLALLFTEFYALKIYHKRETYSRQYVAPRIIQDRKEIDPVSIDYQNPQLLPHRLYFRPSTCYGTGDLTTTFGHINCYGRYFGYQYLGAYFEPPTIYVPRDVAFSTLNQQKDLYQQFQKDPRIIVHASEEVLQTPQQKEVFLQSMPELSMSEKSFFFDSQKAQKITKKDSVYYFFDLPKEFPRYTSTCVLTDDINLITLSIDQQTLQPQQGKLFKPFTFDVQNYRTGKLTLRLPLDFSFKNKKIILRWKESALVPLVWLNEQDHLGFDYNAPNDGWILIHYPYSTNWRISIDGTDSRIFKANTAFIATPVLKGKHRILLQYSPRNPLRFAISLAIACIPITFLTLTTLGLKNENDI